LVRGSPQEEQLSVNLQALYQALCVPIVQELEGKGSKDKRGWVQIILSGEGRENDDFVDDVAGALRNEEFWFLHGLDVVRVDEEIKTRITPEGEVETSERVQLGCEAIAHRCGRRLANSGYGRDRFLELDVKVRQSGEKRALVG
jgi:hypothetical protein